MDEGYNGDVRPANGSWPYGFWFELAGDESSAAITET
jgi:hypothetical protein